MEIRLQTNETYETNITLYALLRYEIDRRESFEGALLISPIHRKFKCSYMPISRKLARAKKTVSNWVIHGDSSIRMNDKVYSLRKKGTMSSSVLAAKSAISMGNYNN